MKKILFILLCLMLWSTVSASKVNAWSNGGYSSDPSNPDYGTHDWIAQHALDWLPISEKQYIVNNLATYVYGTELPDNTEAPDGIGDKAAHHIYYNSAGAVVDDSAAVRASAVYVQALNFLTSGDSANAAKYAGIMSHYIVDLAVFGHVMGSGTDWGDEIHHSDYEDYVNQRTSTYSAEFNIYLSFDGNLRIISAYDAAKEAAYDTTFDVNGDVTCLWMDQNYDWSNPTFKNRCGESLNLAVNYLTDVLHTLYIQKASGGLNEVSTKILSASANSVYFIYADPHRMTLPVAAYDATAGGILYGLCQNEQNIGFDNWGGQDGTPAWLSQGDADRGRLLLNSKCVVCLGSGFPNGPNYVVGYYSYNAKLTPMYDAYEAGEVRYKLQDGTVVASLPDSTDWDHNDLFVIMVFQDANGNFILVIYGYGWRGTLAGGIFFKEVMKPNLASYTGSAYIFRWTDANSDKVPQASEINQVYPT